MKEEGLPGLIRWKRGFERGAAKLEEIRRQEIRSADTIKAIQFFDGLLDIAQKNPIQRKTLPLSKAARVFLGIDK